MILLNDRSQMDGLPLLTAALNCIPGNVAILNQQGKIEMVNEAWVEFNRANGGTCGVRWPGCDYLSVCCDSLGGVGGELLIFPQKQSVRQSCNYLGHA